MVSQKKAQAWSIDLVIGVLIFLLVVGLFYATLTRNQGQDTTSIRISSETIATKLINDPELRIIENNRVQANNLKRLIDDINNNPDLVREQFGVEGDFCVFFEDEEGNLFHIVIQDEEGNDRVYHGVGTGSIRVSDLDCNTPTTS